MIPFYPTLLQFELISRRFRSVGSDCHVHITDMFVCCALVQDPCFDGLMVMAMAMVSMWFIVLEYGYDTSTTMLRLFSLENEGAFFNESTDTFQIFWHRPL